MKDESHPCAGWPDCKNPFDCRNTYLCAVSYCRPEEVMYTNLTYNRLVNEVGIHLLHALILEVVESWTLRKDFS